MVGPLMIAAEKLILTAGMKCPPERDKIAGPCRRRALLCVWDRRDLNTLQDASGDAAGEKPVG